MRSNDAYFGLPHDLFCFTMLQELVSCKIGIPLGSYTHVCTSMHIYEKHFSRVDKYIEEGFFEGVSMPSMESCDGDSLQFVIDSYDDSTHAEKPKSITPYWSDFGLFSNQYFEELSQDEWLGSFQTEGIKKIAINSITN